MRKCAHHSAEMERTPGGKCRLCVRARNKERRRIRRQNDAKFIANEKARRQRAHPTTPRRPRSEVDKRAYKRDWYLRERLRLAVEHALRYADPDIAAVKRLATKAWKAANPALVRVQNANRRARKRHAEGSFTLADIQLLMTGQRGTCAACPAPIADAYMIDHKQPLSRGGSNWPTNLQLLCGPCNLSKGASTMEEWRIRKVMICERLMA